MSVFMNMRAKLTYPMQTDENSVKSTQACANYSREIVKQSRLRTDSR